MTIIPDSPLVVQFSSNIRRIEINGEMYFSVIDIFRNYSEAKNHARSWQQAEAFLLKQGAIKKNWDKTSYTKNVSLFMHQFDGERQRPTPVSTFKMLMRISQTVVFKDWEPLRQWMADLAQERIEEIANPELGIHRAQSRFLDAKIAQGMTPDEAIAFLKEVQEGRIIRKQWTNTLKAAMRYALEGWQYGQVTNTEYRTIYGTDAKSIIAQTGFKTARDGMTVIGRSILNSAELALDAEFRQYENLTFQEGLRLTKEICEIFALPVGRLESRLGISLATGLPLLE